MIGQTISHYRILEKLGGGGMGVVYKARDLRLDRPVALKFLPPQLSANPEARERFLQEAKSASALDHPNTCTVHQIDSTDDGQLFIVMTLYQGETLDRRLVARGRLPVAEAVEIALGAARGLARAHQGGIVHRDVKPSNLMITQEGLVKILDFGIARLAGASRVTHTGKVVGSIDYMSPEHARGDDVDPRTDVWSLGVVLYEMLTGERPFRGGNDQAVLYQILNGNPRPLGEHVVDLPANVEHAVRKALAKPLHERYRTIDELIADLDDQAHGALPTTLSLRPPLSPASRPGPSIAVLPFVDMSPEGDQEYFCDGMAEELIHLLTRVPGLRVASRTSTFQWKGKAPDLAAIRQRLNVETLLEGGVRKAGNRLRITAQLVDLAQGYQLWSGRYDREIADVFAIQDEIAGTIVETLKVELVGKLGPLPSRTTAPGFEIYNLYLQGRFHWNKRTEEGLTKSVTYFKQAIERDPGYARGYAGLADAYLLLGVYGFALPGEVMPRARQAAMRALAIDDRAAEVYTSLGCLEALYDWFWGNAERDFKRAIELDPYYPTAHHWYAINFLTPMGRFEEAAQELQIAHELDPLSLAINASRGLLGFYARRYEEAVAAYRRTLEIDPRFALAHFFLGQALTALGRMEEAVAALLTALTLSPGAAEMEAALGQAYALAGRREEAEQVLRGLEKRGERSYVSPCLVATVHAALGEGDAALDWLERAGRERSADLAWIGVRPVFDGLRDEPRFRALLEQLGLGEFAAGTVVLDRPSSSSRVSGMSGVSEPGER
jgi:serine/threonine protein kinase/tetratricopeptide (TPR) repeat protein